jgi:hypothetical protein
VSNAGKSRLGSGAPARGVERLHPSHADLARQAAPYAVHRLIELMDSEDERVAAVACNSILDRAFGRLGFVKDGERQARGASRQHDARAAGWRACLSSWPQCGLTCTSLMNPKRTLLRQRMIRSRPSKLIDVGSPRPNLKAGPLSCVVFLGDWWTGRLPARSLSECSSPSRAGVV